MTYFPNGEDAFPVMLEELKKAKHYIFLEYFIIAEGIMWNSMLDIIKQKIKEGVEVKIEQDGIFQARVAVENGEKVFAVEADGEVKNLIKDDTADEK